jgi:hypothetical protein
MSDKPRRTGITSTEGRLWLSGSAVCEFRRMQVHVIEVPDGCDVLGRRAEHGVGFVAVPQAPRLTRAEMRQRGVRQRHDNFVGD